LSLSFQALYMCSCSV